MARVKTGGYRPGNTRREQERRLARERAADTARSGQPESTEQKLLTYSRKQIPSGLYAKIGDAGVELTTAACRTADGEWVHDFQTTARLVFGLMRWDYDRTHQVHAAHVLFTRERCDTYLAEVGAARDWESRTYDNYLSVLMRVRDAAVSGAGLALPVQVVTAGTSIGLSSRA